VELETIAVKLRWREGPIIDWNLRVTLLLLIGYTLALALAIVMTIGEVKGRERARRNAETAEREREEYNRLVNSPSVRAGAAAMEAIRARESAGTTRPTSRGTR
jgi:hypothetical protein